MLITLENVLNPEELVETRRLLAQGRWQSGLASAGVQAAQVKNNLQISEQDASLPRLRTIVLAAIERSPLFFSAALPLRILPPNFNRYADANNAYGFHTDCAMRRLTGEPAAYLRSDLSATLFLSDPTSYEGGVLTIEDTFGTHGVKLPAGGMVLYPSSSVHAVSPVTRGERLAAFLFIQSMVRDPGERRLLYDMDMALLALRQEVGETDAVVRLTGSYHNLLRRWADST